MGSRADRSGTAFVAGYGQGEAVRERYGSRTRLWYGLAGGITDRYGALTASLYRPYEARGYQICALVLTLSFFVGFRFDGHTRSLSRTIIVICVIY
jgi:hypothetical protein